MSDEELRNQLQAELSKLFPLVPIREIPRSPMLVGDFLRERIQKEIDWQTRRFVSDISRVLCEVTSPKTHTVDMARLVVDRLKKLEGSRSRMINDYRSLSHNKNVPTGSDVCAIVVKDLIDLGEAL